MRTRTRDLTVGLTAIAVGVTAAALAATIENTTGTPVGPGAFPMVVGLGVALAGALVLVAALRPRAATAPVPSAPAQLTSEPSRGRALILPAAVGGFCLIAVTFSLTVATAAMFVLCGRHLGRYRWLPSVAIGLLGAVALHVVFRVLLEVPLPVDRAL
jgi:putative tricarboxylic transport membrane protein